MRLPAKHTRKAAGAVGYADERASRGTAGGKLTPGKAMQVFRIKTAYDETGNSPWDALWYDGDDEDLDSLDCQMRLGLFGSPRRYG